MTQGFDIKYLLQEIELQVSYHLEATDFDHEFGRETGHALIVDSWCIVICLCDQVIDITELLDEENKARFETMAEEYAESREGFR